MPDDKLTFSIRIHDPAEKKDPTKSTAWFVRDVPRADLALTIDEFLEKHVKPAFEADLSKFFTVVASK